MPEGKLPVPMNAAAAVEAVHDPVMRPDHAAVYLGVARATLSKWRVSGSGPLFIKPSKRVVLYRRSDLDAWLRGHRLQRSTSDTATTRKPGA